MVAKLTTPKKLKDITCKKQKRLQRGEKVVEETEKEAPFRLVAFVNNFLHLTFPNVEVYISSQQIYNLNDFYAYNSKIFDNIKRVISENERVLHCEVYDFREGLDETTGEPLSEPFFKGE